MHLLESHEEHRVVCSGLGESHGSTEKLGAILMSEGLFYHGKPQRCVCRAAFQKVVPKICSGRTADSLDAISISCWSIAMCSLGAGAIRRLCRDFEVGFLSKGTGELGWEGRRGRCLFTCK